MRLTLLLFAILSFCAARGQTFIGISCDFGNPVSYMSNVGETYFKKPRTISGNITLLQQEEMRNHWFLQYGVNAGVLGYNVTLELKDTISNGKYGPIPFLEYSPLYGSFQFGFGRNFNWSKGKFSLLLSGGITRYFYLFDEVWQSVGGMDGNNNILTLYDCEIHPTKSKISVFTEISILTEESKRVSIGLSYRHHFMQALNGTYNFYHVEQPSNGSLFVTHRVLSILLLVKLGKKKLPPQNWSEPGYP